MIFFFNDTETTGIDPAKHGLIQISGTIDVLHDDNTFEIMEKINFKVRPFPGDLLSKQAMELHKLTKEDLQKFDHPGEIHEKLNMIFGKYVDKYNKQDKMIFIAYNARFDYDFVRKFYEKNNDQFFGSWFSFPPIDIMNIAIDYLLFKRREMKNFKLETVAEELGVGMAEKNYHDAYYDIEIAKQIYLKIKKERKEIV